MLISLLSWCLAGPISIDVHTVDTELDAGTRAHLEYMLWQVRDFYGRRLGIDYPRVIALDLTLYGDRSAFKAVAEEAGRPSWSGGWFQRGRDGVNRAVFHVGANRAAFTETYLHESSHFLVSYGGRIPRWLNEGLAVVLGGSHTEGGALVGGVGPRQRASLGREGVGSVEALLTDVGSWKDLPGDTARIRYVRAGALALFLLSTPNGGDTLEAIARAYRQRGDARAPVRAVESTYRGGLRLLQEDFETWAADPPERVVLTAQLKGALTSDEVWTKCPDGRLVRTETGCGY